MLGSEIAKVLRTDLSAPLCLQTLQKVEIPV